MRTVDGIERPGAAFAVRFALVFWALLLSAWCLGLATQQVWAKALWIWPQVPALNHVFVASIAAAIAAPILWIGLSGELGAAAPGALNLLVLSLGAAWTLARDPSFGENARVRLYAWIFAASVVALAATWAWARRYPVRDPRPTPAPVRWSFALFAVLLVVVGTALVRGAPHVFPWPLKPTHSALYGWIFLGAAVYFAHGVVRPSWGNARGPLLGFLAYDLVLLGPYFAHLDKVLPEHRASLVVYLAVLLYSTALAAWFLFLSPATRFGSGASPTIPASVPDA